MYTKSHTPILELKIAEELLFPSPDPMNEEDRPGRYSYHPLLTLDLDQTRVSTTPSPLPLPLTLKIHFKATLYKGLLQWFRPRWRHKLKHFTSSHKQKKDNTNLKTINKQNCQKIKLRGTPTIKEVKKHSSRP